MSLRVAITAAALALLAAATATAPAAMTPLRVPACAAGHLAVSFTHVRGSEGAGNTVYELTVVNRATRRCLVGRPTIQLLDVHGAALPSRTLAVGGTSARVALRPGRKATAGVRFTPDIPARNEHQHGACEPLAHSVRVRFAASPGAATGPVTPPTPVCQNGALQVMALGA